MLDNNTILKTAEIGKEHIFLLLKKTGQPHIYIEGKDNAGNHYIFASPLEEGYGHKELYDDARKFLNKELTVMGGGILLIGDDRHYRCCGRSGTYGEADNKKIEEELNDFESRNLLRTPCHSQVPYTS
ncbi:MAG: hypothetical protein D6769_00505 [Methanobacteriota archaeon]|nr:MAG: hypothetical protein D6769_00505 [Euryarchaeota archaeon]